VCDETSAFSIWCQIFRCSDYQGFFFPDAGRRSRGVRLLYGARVGLTNLPLLGKVSRTVGIDVGATEVYWWQCDDGEGVGCAVWHFDRPVLGANDG
jgi:hypothetical protein